MTTFKTSRELDASPSVIFEAFEVAERLARWWGPNGFSNHFEVFDFQVGGRWVFSMVGPDGATYPNESVFSVIEPARRIVIDHVCPPYFQLVVTLQESGHGTLLRWEQTFADAGVAEAVRHIVEPANEQNLDRLSVELKLPKAPAV